MKQSNLLVIDDDPDILDALRFVLEDEGYLVRTGEKAEHAEKLLTGTTSLPDLIILDVLLSGQDGRVICQKLKSETRTKHIPILMISAHPDVKRSVKEVGADDFIAKPFDVDDMLRSVSTLLLGESN